jgi:hypothetical protein
MIIQRKNSVATSLRTCSITLVLYLETRRCRDTHSAQHTVHPFIRTAIIALILVSLGARACAVVLAKAIAVPGVAEEAAGRATGLIMCAPIAAGWRFGRIGAYLRIGVKVGGAYSVKTD